jgi:hypothetical protein
MMDPARGGKPSVPFDAGTFRSQVAEPGSALQAILKGDAPTLRYAKRLVEETPNNNRAINSVLHDVQTQGYSVDPKARAAAVARAKELGTDTKALGRATTQAEKLMTQATRALGKQQPFKAHADYLDFGMKIKQDLDAIKQNNRGTNRIVEKGMLTRDQLAATVRKLMKDNPEMRVGMRNQLVESAPFWRAATKTMKGTPGRRTAVYGLPILAEVAKQMMFGSNPYKDAPADSGTFW